MRIKRSTQVACRKTADKMELEKKKKIGANGEYMAGI